MAGPRSGPGTSRSYVPAKWTYFYLDFILDIFSWSVVDAESATLFKALFDDAIAKHEALPGQLTLHADRGAPMKAKATAQLLAGLDVTKSHSRPHTSNDNAFSESHFRDRSLGGRASVGGHHDF